MGLDAETRRRLRRRMLLRRWAVIALVVGLVSLPLAAFATYYVNARRSLDEGMRIVGVPAQWRLVERDHSIPLIPPSLMGFDSHYSAFSVYETSQSYEDAVAYVIATVQRADPEAEPDSELSGVHDVPTTSVSTWHEGVSLFVYVHQTSPVTVEISASRWPSS